MSGTSSPAANAARRRNAQKAGRPPGIPNKPFGGERLELRDLCRAETPACFEELKRLAYGARAEQVRLGACNAILDRAWGKVPQAIEGSVSGIIQVLIHPDLLPDGGEQGLIIDGSATDA